MEDDQNVVVQTNRGPVRGRKRLTVNQESYYSFQGIPYAKPPVAELRFKDPQEAEKWTEPLDATQEGPCSFAIEFETKSLNPNSSEDCLRLNVFSKDLHTKFPVMVWIHGGGFEFGSSSEAQFGPDFLLTKNVILITINHRLGALGFLSIADKEYEIPGNAGLKDQTFALRWVRQNCANFGGDPKNITVFGNSAGGASVHYQLISDYARGLFDKAIVQSGSAFNPWANRVSTNDLNERLARNLGWNGEGGIREMMNVLKSASAADIVLKQNDRSEAEKQNGLYFSFVPVVEPYNEGNCFLPMNLSEMNRSAWGNAIPMLIGGTSDEGFLFYSEFEKKTGMFDDNSYFTNALPREMNLDEESGERQRLGDDIRRFYYGDEKPTMANLESYVPLLGDKLFLHGINAIVLRRAENKQCAPTFLYRFNFDSENLIFFKLFLSGKRVKGTTHGEEQLYIFKFSNINENIAANVNSAEYKVMNFCLDIWTEFARKGNPNCEAINTLNWEPVSDADSIKCLNISEECSIIDFPEKDRLAFWDSLYKF